MPDERWLRNGVKQIYSAWIRPGCRLTIPESESESESEPGSESLATILPTSSRFLSTVLYLLRSS